MNDRTDRVWFYLSLAVLNLAAGIMFYTVTFRPPVAMAASFQSITDQQKTRQPMAVPAIKGTPVRIVIPSLTLDLPVGVGTYDPGNNSWTLDTEKAFYADVSLPLNDSNGRTLIYGHAQAPIFGVLAELSPAALAEVYTDNGYLFRYVYATVKEVAPTDTSVFGSDGPPTLVLQTCSGPWDVYRALYYFDLESVRKV